MVPEGQLAHVQHSTANNSTLKINDWLRIHHQNVYDPYDMMYKVMQVNLNQTHTQTSAVQYTSRCKAILISQRVGWKINDDITKSLWHYSDYKMTHLAFSLKGLTSVGFSKGSSVSLSCTNFVKLWVETRRIITIIVIKHTRNLKIHRIWCDTHSFAINIGKHIDSRKQAHRPHAYDRTVVCNKYAVMMVIEPQYSVRWRVYMYK